VPELTTILVFAAAALVLIAVPGPNLVYLVTRSMSEGRRAGVASALGIETGTLVHVAAAALGLSALLASSPLAFDVVRYAGAAYLLWLGIRTLRARGDDAIATAGAPRAPSLARAYGQAVVIQLLNPKVALFFLAFLPQFVDPARGAVAGQVLVLGAVLAVLGLLLDVLYALAADAAARRLRGRTGAAGHGRLLTGGTYVVLGVAAALVGGRPRGG
jgi:threonine/homoserine/homoserine lactone efflux protein